MHPIKLHSAAISACARPLMGIPPWEPLTNCDNTTWNQHGCLQCCIAGSSARGPAKKKVSDAIPFCEQSWNLLSEWKRISNGTDTAPDTVTLQYYTSLPGWDCSRIDKSDYRSRRGLPHLWVTRRLVGLLRAVAHTLLKWCRTIPRDVTYRHARDANFRGYGLPSVDTDFRATKEITSSSGSIGCIQRGASSRQVVGDVEGRSKCS
jgi:hypothetical protein